MCGHKFLEINVLAVVSLLRYHEKKERIFRMIKKIEEIILA